MIKINHQINEEGINNPVFFETQTYSNFHPLIRVRLIFQLRGPSNSPRGRKKNQNQNSSHRVCHRLINFLCNKPLRSDSPQFRGNLTLGGLMRLRRNVSHDRRYK